MTNREKIWERLQAQGKEAAYNLGIELGLTHNTMRGLIRVMLNGEYERAKVKRVPETFGKRRVFLSYDKDREGVVVHEGDEVSDVRWNDGSCQFVPNERLVTIPEGVRR